MIALYKVRTTLMYLHLKKIFMSYIFVFLIVLFRIFIVIIVSNHQITPKF